MCYYINMYFLLAILVTFPNMNTFMKLLFSADCIKRCSNYWYSTLYYPKFKQSIDILTVKIKDLKMVLFNFYIILFTAFRFGNVHIIDVNKEMAVLLHTTTLFVSTRTRLVNNQHIQRHVNGPPILVNTLYMDKIPWINIYKKIGMLTPFCLRTVYFLILFMKIRYLCLCNELYMRSS